jgi:hypothetical protein
MDTFWAMQPVQERKYQKVTIYGHTLFAPTFNYPWE